MTGSDMKMQTYDLDTINELQDAVSKLRYVISRLDTFETTTRQNHSTSSGAGSNPHNVDRNLRYQPVSMDIQSCGDFIICLNHAGKVDRHHADRYVLEEYWVLICSVCHSFYRRMDHT